MTRRKPPIIVSGAKGRLGQALLKHLARRDVRGYDVGEYDVLREAPAGHTLVHLARKPLAGTDRDCLGAVEMLHAVLRDAEAAGTARLVLASSTRADLAAHPHAPYPWYGVAKAAQEAVLEEFSARLGLPVVALRIGAVDGEDGPELGQAPIALPDLMRAFDAAIRFDERRFVIWTLADA